MDSDSQARFARYDEARAFLKKNGLSIDKARSIADFCAAYARELSDIEKDNRQAELDLFGGDDRAPNEEDDLLSVLLG